MTLVYLVPLLHEDNNVSIRQTSPHRLVWTGSEVRDLVLTADTMHK